MAQIHMSEAELARDLHAVLEKVRQGAEIVVEREDCPVAVLRPPSPPRRTLSASLAIAREREKARGYAVTADSDFAAAVDEIVSARKPWNPATWE
jgi:antitoxin (DNA-binding transcriptional repressor) of toxin-antitoxin stability system